MQQLHNTTRYLHKAHTLAIIHSMTQETELSIADFRRWGRQGGKQTAKRGRAYFQKIAAMRKNPGRKPGKRIVTTI